MEFGERLLESAQQTFVPMFRRVHERYYNNSVVSILKKPEYVCDFKGGRAEYYIPTVVNSEGRLQFHRIVITVKEKLAEEEIIETVRVMKKQLHKAPGLIDSETFIIAAPKAAVKKIIRGFRHNPHCRGYMTLIVVAEKPKAAWARILTLIKGFWLKRLKRLSEALNIEAELLSEYLIEEVNRSNNYSINSKIRIRSETLQTIFFSFVGTVRYLGDMLRIALLEAVNEQNARGVGG